MANIDESSELMDIDEVKSDQDVNRRIEDEYISKSLQSWAFVDVQGFEAQRERFICKEICVISDERVYHAIVKPSFYFKYLSEVDRKNAIESCQNDHRLTFDCGDTHINEATGKAFMMILNRKVLVNKVKKSKWLQYIFRHCGPIECLCTENLNIQWNLPPLASYHFCDYHYQVFRWNVAHCCLADALKLKHLVINNIHKVNFLLYLIRN